ncbi:MAG: hypothetical protein V7631_357 [Massilia sp.]
MSDKHKGMVNEHGRSVAREKMVPVAPGSQQGKPPGSGAGNRQSGGAGLGARQGGSDVGSRGGPGSQLGGRSARQQAQRMQARAEQDRLGMSQQSGYGGLEQGRHAGSESSPLAPASRQSGEAGSSGRGHPEQPASDYGSAESGGGKDNQS